MKIEISRYPPERGRKEVLVDGVRWGIIVMSQHGCWGSSYNFQQVGAQFTGIRNATVRSAKKHKWDKEPADPLDQRLLQEATHLINTGELRNPAVVLQERERDAKLYSEQVARDEAKRAAAYLRQARALVEQHGTMDPDGLAKAIAAALQRERDHP